MRNRIWQPLLILVLCLNGAPLRLSAEPAVGMTAAEVIAEYGAPQSKLTRENRQIFRYADFEVVLLEGRVTKVRPHTTTGSANRTTTTEPTVVIPAPAAPTTDPAPPPAAPPITIGGIVIALWPFYIVIAVIALAPFVPALRRWRRRWYYRHAAAMPAPAPSADFPVQSLTPELLPHLEWKRFALLVQRFYEASQATVTVNDTGANGEVTLIVRPGGSQSPFAVWCLPWGAREVNAAAMREFRGTMALLDQDEGRVVTMADFKPDAVSYGVANHIVAISGAGFCDRFVLLPVDVKARILAEVTAGDFTTPTCPHCDVKLVRTTAEVRFWSCVNAPRCATRIYIR